MCCCKPLSFRHRSWQQLATATKGVARKGEQITGTLEGRQEEGESIHQKTGPAPTAVTCGGKASFLPVKQKRAQDRVLCWLVRWPLQVTMLNPRILPAKSEVGMTVPVRRTVAEETGQLGSPEQMFASNICFNAHSEQNMNNNEQKPKSPSPSVLKAPNY